MGGGGGEESGRECMHSYYAFILLLFQFHMRHKWMVFVVTCSSSSSNFQNVQHHVRMRRVHRTPLFAMAGRFVWMWGRNQKLSFKIVCVCLSSWCRPVHVCMTLVCECVSKPRIEIACESSGMNVWKSARNVIRFMHRKHYAKWQRSG